MKAHDAPHRVANHNFGSWESWEITSSGLVNLQWRHKVPVDVTSVTTHVHVAGTSA